MGATARKPQPLPIDYDVEDDDAIYNTRMPSSTRRYRPSQPIEHDTFDDVEQQSSQFTQPIHKRRSSATQAPVDTPDTTTTPPRTPRQTSGMASKTKQATKATQAIHPPKTDALPAERRFPWPTLLIGMVVTIVLVMSFMALSSWWRVYQDDLHYGRPRTFQMDAVVGHNDSASNPTHFIFLNLNRHVEIIEIPGGDAAHTRIYTGPTLFGDGQDLTPVTGEIRDANHDGKPDLVVHIQDQQIIYLNDGTTFHPQ